MSTSVSSSESDRLALSEILAFAAPSLGLGFAFLLNAMLLMKYATDVLLIAPATMGVILLGARLWDAVSDPLAGNLSDRTRSRMGRRRPWLLASILPLAIGTWMIWSPPLGLEGNGLIAWMVAAVLVFYTAVTMFSVPYYSLGAELSPNYHERTRVFAFQQGLQISATLGAGVFAAWVLFWADDARQAAAQMALILIAVMTSSILFTVWRVRERVEAGPRAERKLFAAMRDVFANPHARILYLVYFIETIGGAGMASSAAYYTDHVLKAGEYLPVFMASYVVPGLLLLPVVLKLSRRFGKVRLWQASLLAQVFAFLCLATLQEGDFLVACLFVGFLSFGGTAGQVMAPSIQTDVVDYDELQTGERKEGAYFAVRSFVLKASFGVGPAMLGFVLSSTGFEPGGEIGEDAIFGMRLLIGYFPAIGALLGAALLVKFKLTAEEHARIRAELDDRAETNVA